MTTEPDAPPTSLEAKVAAILNARELAINMGSAEGVRTGMKFKVLAETPITIADPDTGINLGVVDREKVRVMAVEVQPQLAVCRTYHTRRIGGGSLYFGRQLEEMAAPPRTVVETLKADSSSFPPPLTEKESYVKRGDRVVQLSKEELNSE